MLNTVDILTLAKQERLSDIISLCEKTLKEESAKERGGTSELKRYKAALRLLGELENQNNAHAYIEDGKQYMTNGYVAFELNNPIENLPEGEHHDIKRWCQYSLSGYEEMHPFCASELRGNLKIAKANRTADISKKKKPLYMYEGGLYKHENENRIWGCSVEQILNVIDIMGEEYDLYLPFRNRFDKAVFENDKGCAILVPINLLKPTNN